MRLSKTAPLRTEKPEQAQGRAAAWVFFLLVFASSVPLYLIGITGWRLPGLPMLPLSALMGFVPMAVAVLLLGRTGGHAAVIRLLASLCDPIRRAGVIWLCVAVVFMPLAGLIEYVVLTQRVTALPAFSFDPASVLFLFAAFFVGAIGEELGWQSYAYPALRGSHKMIGAALILGSVWAAWHVIPFAQLGHGVGWIFWHSLSAVALRVIIVWFFEAAGRHVLIAVIFHAMINLSWAVFPEDGSAYDPFVAFLIVGPIATVAALFGMPGTGRRAIADTSSAKTNDLE